MGFKLIVPDPSYRIHLASNGHAGYCVGQSVNWILDILEEKEASLKPPDFNRGRIYQNAYVEMSRKHPGSQKQADLYQLKATAYSAKTSRVRPEIACTIKDEIAETNGSARMLMEKLTTTPGFVFLLMGWGNTLNNHAMAMLKLNNNNVFLYDPNYGLHELTGPKSDLYGQVKAYLSKNTTVFKNAQMKDGLLLSTTYPLKIKYM